MSIFSSKLRTLREQKDLRQVDIANILGVSIRTYSNYELGKSAPNVDVLKKLIKFYKISPGYFLTE